MQVIYLKNRINFKTFAYSVKFSLNTYINKLVLNKIKRVWAPATGISKLQAAA